MKWALTGGSAADSPGKRTTARRLRDYGPHMRLVFVPLRMDRRAFIVGAAALALAPRGLAEIEAGREVALVTADLESRLVAVDLETGRVRPYVPTLPRPRSIEAVGSCSVVAHSEIGLVTIVRNSSLSVAHVLRGFGEPRYAAGHP